MSPSNKEKAFAKALTVAFRVAVAYGGTRALLVIYHQNLEGASLADLFGDRFPYFLGAGLILVFSGTHYLKAWRAWNYEE